MGRKKSLKRSTVSCLYSCLMYEAYPKVLKWTENDKEFSILFKRKGSPGWHPSDLDFFKELDSRSPSKKEKYSKQPDYDLGCKRRCKANLRKLCEDNILKYIGKKVINKSTKWKYYKFLEIPKEMENYKPSPEENNNKKLCFESFEKQHKDTIELIEEFYGFDEDIYESYFKNSNTSDTCMLPEKELKNKIYYINSTSDNELPKMELSNVKEFLQIKQIKASLPGYDELLNNLSAQHVPLWSPSPQIKNGMNIDEVVDNL